ncbi:MAG: STAS domain-containing protein [Actinomycetota bacterium]
MELVLENGAIGSWTVVRVAGELDLHTSPQLRDHTLALIGEPPVWIALDMTQVSFMDSSSLGMLVTCLKRIRERDGRLVLAGVTGSPLKVFALTGLDRVFDLVPSTDDLPQD